MTETVDNTTSDDDLNNIAIIMDIKLYKIVMKDELKNVRFKEGYYIINLQSSTKGTGTHWTGLYVSNKKYDCFYFDSFGGPPPKEVVFFCKNNGRRLGFNNYIIQDLNSSSCGLYVLAFFLYIKINISKNIYKVANDFPLYNFEDNTSKNENHLFNFFKSYFLSKNRKTLPKIIKNMLYYQSIS